MISPVKETAANDEEFTQKIRPNNLKAEIIPERREAPMAKQVKAHAKQRPNLVKNDSNMAVGPVVTAEVESSHLLMNDPQNNEANIEAEETQKILELIELVEFGINPPEESYDELLSLTVKIDPESIPTYEFNELEEQIIYELDTMEEYWDFAVDLSLQERIATLEFLAVSVESPEFTEPILKLASIIDEQFIAEAIDSGMDEVLINPELIGHLYTMLHLLGYEDPKDPIKALVENGQLNELFISIHSLAKTLHVAENPEFKKSARTLGSGKYVFGSMQELGRVALTVERQVQLLMVA